MSTRTSLNRPVWHHNNKCVTRIKIWKRINRRMYAKYKNNPRVLRGGAFAPVFLLFLAHAGVAHPRKYCDKQLSFFTPLHSPHSLANTLIVVNAQTRTILIPRIIFVDWGWGLGWKRVFRRYNLIYERCLEITLMYCLRKILKSYWVDSAL